MKKCVWCIVFFCLLIGITEAAGPLPSFCADASAAEKDAVSPGNLSAAGKEQNRGKANERMFKALVEKDTAAFSSALADGADVNSYDYRGITPLCYMIKFWNQPGDIVASLLKRKADVNLAITKPLEYCYDWNNRLLFLPAKYGATAKPKSVMCMTDPAGLTPLMFAVLRHDKDMVGLLVQKGAYLEAKDSLGRTVYEIIRRNPQLAPMGKALSDARAKYRRAASGQPAAAGPSPSAAGRPQVSSISGTTSNSASLSTGNKMVDSDALVDVFLYGLADYDPHAPLYSMKTNNSKLNPAGYKEFHAAILNDDIKKMRGYLDKGADPGVKDADGETALMTAVRKGRTEIVRLLVEKGADVNAADHHGTTALMLAARNCMADILTLLLEKGAAVNAYANNKATSLVNAAFTACGLECTKILISHGANVQWDNNRAARIALQRGRLDILEVLRKAGGKPD